MAPHRQADRRDLAQLVELEQERSLETSAKIAASRSGCGPTAADDVANGARVEVQVLLGQRRIDGVRFTMASFVDDLGSRQE